MTYHHHHTHHTQLEVQTAEGPEGQRATVYIWHKDAQGSHAGGFQQRYASDETEAEQEEHMAEVLRAHRLDARHFRPINTAQPMVVVPGGAWHEAYFVMLDETGAEMLLNERDSPSAAMLGTFEPAVGAVLANMELYIPDDTQARIRRMPTLPLRVSYVTHEERHRRTVLAAGFEALVPGYRTEGIRLMLNPLFRPDRA